MDYKIEQLLPLAAELADRYTSKESTSVTYETAGALMEDAYCSTRLYSPLSNMLPT